MLTDTWAKKLSTSHFTHSRVILANRWRWVHYFNFLRWDGDFCFGFELLFIFARLHICIITTLMGSDL